MVIERKKVEVCFVLMNGKYRRAGKCLLKKVFTLSIDFIATIAYARADKRDNSGNRRTHCNHLFDHFLRKFVKRTLPALVGNADDALYRVKKNNRHTICCVHREHDVFLFCDDAIEILPPSIYDFCVLSCCDGNVRRMLLLWGNE